MIVDKARYQGFIYPHLLFTECERDTRTLVYTYTEKEKQLLGKDKVVGLFLTIIFISRFCSCLNLSLLLLPLKTDRGRESARLSFFRDKRDKESVVVICLHRWTMDTPQKSITQIETPVSKSRFEVYISIINTYSLFLVNVLVLLVSSVGVIWCQFWKFWCESLNFKPFLIFQKSRVHRFNRPVLTRSKTIMSF